MPCRPEHVDGEDYEIGGEDAVGSHTVEAEDRNRPALADGLEELRGDQEAAEDEEEVDAHPAELCDGGDTIGHSPAEVVEHDGEDREGAKVVEACDPG